MPVRFEINGIAGACRAKVDTSFVNGPITGSIIGNVLLVFGAAALGGGSRYKVQRFNRSGARASTTSLSLASIALLIPTAIKINNLDTEVICTNLTPAAVDIGLEVFDQTGTRGNTIGSGNGALLDVAPGATVTITTGQTKVIHEDKIIVLEAPVIDLGNGSARVVATSAQIGCVAFAVDSKHKIEAPPSIVAPPTITPLAASAACSPAACDDGNPCTADGCNAAGKCTHAAVADGTTCDDGNACTTDDACAAGACRPGNAVSCGADTPCHHLAVCDPQCVQCIHGALMQFHQLD